MLDILISNANWCYRVPFNIVNSSEVERIGEEAYVIKETDITVYQLQYDQAKGYTQDFLYLCLDLFSSHIDGVQTHPDITNGDKIRPKTYIDDPKEIVPVSVVIVAALVGLLLVTALYRIRYTSRKQTVQSVVQETPDVGIVSDTVMSEEDSQAIEVIHQEPDSDQNDLDGAGKV